MICEVEHFINFTKNWQWSHSAANILISIGNSKLIFWGLLVQVVYFQLPNLNLKLNKVNFRFLATWIFLVQWALVVDRTPACGDHRMLFGLAVVHHHHLSCGVRVPAGETSSNPGLCQLHAPLSVPLPLFLTLFICFFSITSCYFHFHLLLLALLPQQQSAGFGPAA